MVIYHLLKYFWSPQLFSVEWNNKKIIYKIPVHCIFSILHFPCLPTNYVREIKEKL